MSAVSVRRYQFLRESFLIQTPHTIAVTVP